MRTLGSCPGRTATGILHTGPVDDEYRKIEFLEWNTIWSHSVMLSFIVLWTLVSLDFEVLLAKGQFTMLALEREEIDEKTGLV